MINAFINEYTVIDAYHQVNRGSSRWGTFWARRSGRLRWWRSPGIRLGLSWRSCCPCADLGPPTCPPGRAPSSDSISCCRSAPASSSLSHRWPWGWIRWRATSGCRSCWSWPRSATLPGNSWRRRRAARTIAQSRRWSRGSRGCLGRWWLTELQVQILSQHPIVLGFDGLLDLSGFVVDELDLEVLSLALAAYCREDCLYLDGLSEGLVRRRKTWGQCRWRCWASGWTRRKMRCAGSRGPEERRLPVLSWVEYYVCIISILSWEVGDLLSQSYLHLRSHQRATFRGMPSAFLIVPSESPNTALVEALNCIFWFLGLLLTYWEFSSWPFLTWSHWFHYKSILLASFDIINNVPELAQDGKAWPQAEVRPKAVLDQEGTPWLWRPWAPQVNRSTAEVGGRLREEEEIALQG